MPAKRNSKKKRDVKPTLIIAGTILLIILIFEIIPVAVKKYSGSKHSDAYNKMIDDANQYYETTCSNARTDYNNAKMAGDPDAEEKYQQALKEAEELRDKQIEYAELNYK